MRRNENFSYWQADGSGLPVQEFASTWEGRNLSDQVRLLRQLVQQVDYDGPHGKVSITFRPGGAAALAAAWNQPKDNQP